jgi:amino acid transporter
MGSTGVNLPSSGNGTPSEAWEFAGWGKSERMTDLGRGPVEITPLDQPRKHHLGVWRSTAICGNDITSSVLYVTALTAVQAGALAPIVLLAVGGVLYLYRKVYAEVGSALPLNGGTYTVLLNTTNKRTAAMAACLTLLSYLATAVISASEAMHYAHNIFGGLDVRAGTVALLAVFALLNIIGITESGAVALVIFGIHLATMTALAVFAGVAVAADPSLLRINWALPEPTGLSRALFFGFAAAMLGISGFESSANFIEEQKAGVFPKTLRNMWLAVILFNPLISLLSMGILPLEEIRKAPPDLLARMGHLTQGPRLAWIVSFDAFLVLSGAVLTSYVGVTGLVRRMSLDRCMPKVFLRENRVRGTNHWIVVAFFALCVSILLVTRGRIETLAGVYTLSFLSVMMLFALGNMLLKKKRARLPRQVRAGWPTVSLAMFAALLGLLGNVLLDPLNLEVFALYLLATGAAVGIMFVRLELLKLGLSILRAVVEKVKAFNEWARANVLRKIEEINSLMVVYFTKGDDLAILNRAALYVLTNEQTTRMKVVHVYGEERDIPPDLAKQLADIDQLYPQLRIDFLAVRGTFGPELIEELSRRLNVPKNYMFIGTPGDRFSHRVEDLGGVRLIL